MRTPRRVRDSILIVVEGESTEASYFREVKARLARLNRQLALRIVAVGGGSMDNKIQRAVEEAKEGIYGEVWCVVDADKYSESRKKADGLIAKARAVRVRLAISNPCFEVWYLCHWEVGHSELTADEAKRRAKGKLGSNWEQPARHFAALEEHLAKAVANAESIRKCHHNFDPCKCNRSTTVDELMKALNLI